MLVWEKVIINSQNICYNENNTVYPWIFHNFHISYLLSSIFWYSILICFPRALACIIVMILHNLSSLMSSNAPNIPALKKIYRKGYKLIIKYFKIQGLWFKVRQFELSSTLVRPKRYCVVSKSKLAINFSVAFLLSTNCPSGAALGFKMRYLYIHTTYYSRLSQAIH